jgi:hypothetical protein
MPLSRSLSLALARRGTALGRESEALAGHVVIRSAGLGREPEDRRELRAWIAKLAEGLVFPKYEGKEEPDLADADTESTREPVDVK